MRAVRVDSSPGPQNNRRTQWADPWEALTPDSPEPALPALLIHQGRATPKLGVRVKNVNRSLPAPHGELGDNGETGGSLG